MAINLKIDLKNINFDFILGLSLKIKILIVSIFIVLIFGLYIGLVGYGKYKSFNALNAEIQELTQKRDAKKRDAANLPRLKAEVERLEKELKYSMTVLPNTEEIPSVVSSIENNLKRYNLEILSFKPEKEVKKDFYAEIPINLVFSGGFRETGEFLQTLARYPRLIHIMGLNIKSPTPKDGKVILTVDTKAVTFRFLNPDELPKKEEKKSEKK